MKKLISIDLKADFGFFRKPDANNMVNLSYNIIHKPALLGILGAIVGLEGYREKNTLPSYYNVFRDIKIGIQPLEDEKGCFKKTNIKYSNTVGYANNKETFLTEEMTLVNPRYRVFILIDTENEWHKKLSDNLSGARSVFIPYFGKNEFTAWWEKESYKEYEYEEGAPTSDSITITTLFLKELAVKDNKAYPDIDPFTQRLTDVPFMYFERLPKDFQIDLKQGIFQYDMGDFVYSSYMIKNGNSLRNLYHLKESDTYVQLL